MNVLSVLTHTALMQKGWKDVEADAPPVLGLFLKLVIPLSLLPACMLWWAGSQHGDAFMAGYSAKPWGPIAVLFFLTELLTVALMGWLTQTIAKTKGVELAPRHAYLIAGVAPIPLWLSSLTLVVPHLWVAVLASGVALVLSFNLIYRGVQVLCHITDDVVDMEMSHAIMAAGLIAWALLLLGIVAA